MSAEKDSCCVRLPEIARTQAFHWNTFRGSLVASGLFAVGVILIIAFIYWPTSRYVTSSIDRLITDRANMFSSLSPHERLQALQQHLSEDPRRVKLAGLFDSQGNRIMGNIQSLPRGLLLDAPAQELSLVR